MIHVSDGYFPTIGARMIAGREYTPHGSGGRPAGGRRERGVREEVVSRRERGREVHRPGRAAPVEIIGVVGDIRQVAIDEPARRDDLHRQHENWRVKVTLVARTQGEPLLMARRCARRSGRVDGDQPITSIFTFDDA